VAINAKYIHTNLAIRVLTSYLKKTCPAVIDGKITIEIAEWNINEPSMKIVRGVLESEPDLVLFSTYIWNRDVVFSVLSDIKKVIPSIITGAGGPEVSWTAQEDMEAHEALDLVISGDGEIPLSEIVARMDSGQSLHGIPGLHTRKGNEILYSGPGAVLENLDAIPFIYEDPSLTFNTDTHIVYYESSRGCPFSCAFCLSSRDTRVRYYSLGRVFHDLSFFLEHKFPLVKFIDRTFNLDPKRYLAIWEFIRDNYNDVTTFHFEISAEILSAAAFSLLETLPPGSVQFEIGIQSTNPETLEAVGRSSNPEKLAEAIRKIPSSIHRHVDLIAGLPLEGLERFGESFNFVWQFHAEMLQLGFLKILPGSPMEALARSTEGYLWSSFPPYEVLQTPHISYDDLCVLKDVEQLVDTWYNSGLVRHTLIKLVELRKDMSAFNLFLELTGFVRSWFPDGDLFLPRKPIDVFACLADFVSTQPGLLEYLKYDFFMKGKPGAIPEWLDRHYSRNLHDDALVANGFLDIQDSGFAPSRRTVYARTDYEEFFFELDKPPSRILFVYSKPGKKEKTPECVIL
ncbi:MAG TPA: DUF4080 domain-containing protein, partial [Treponema sp.]|nr:DUF4080 domain-containing protein [Treponema sp.]